MHSAVVLQSRSARAVRGQAHRLAVRCWGALLYLLIVFWAVDASKLFGDGVRFAYETVGRWSLVTMTIALSAALILSAPMRRSTIAIAALIVAQLPAFAESNDIWSTLPDGVRLASVFLCCAAAAVRPSYARIIPRAISAACTTVVLGSLVFYLLEGRAEATITDDFIGRARFAGIAVHPNILGELAAFGFGISLQFSLTQWRRRRAKATLALAIAVACASSAYLSGSRIAAIGLVFAFIYATFSPSFGRLVARRRAASLNRLTALATFVVIAVICLPPVYSLVLAGDQQRVASNAYELSNMSRMLAWSSAWSSFMAHPIFGEGFQSTLVVSAAPGSEEGMRYAHNLVLTLAMRSGFVGLAMFVALVVLSTRVCLKALRRRDRAQARQQQGWSDRWRMIDIRSSVFVMMSSFLFSSVEGALQGTWPVDYCFALTAGLVAGAASGSAKHRRSRHPWSGNVAASAAVMRSSVLEPGGALVRTYRISAGACCE